MSKAIINKRRTFVTIYLDFENVHVMKEPGQIGYMLSKLYGFKSEVVSYKNGKYPNLKYTPDLKLRFIKKRKSIRFIDLNCIWYVIKNAIRIDILHMQHFKLDTLAAGFIYKMINPKGFFFVRLNFGPSDYFGKQPDIQFWFKNDGKLKTKIKNFLQKKFANYVDLWSEEDIESSSFVTKKYFFFRDKLIEVHNGINLNLVKELNIQLKSFRDKENIILYSTARIGSYQKASEVLLETYALLHEDMNWTLHIAGSMRKEFENMLKVFFERNPGLKTKIFIHGELEKKDLFELYNKAKIFCLLSRYESFPNVLAEAMYFKNTLIVTNFAGSKIVIDNNKSGCIVERDNPKQIANVLMDYINDNELLERTGNHAHNFALNNLGWDKIATNLLREMEIHGYQR